MKLPPIAKKLLPAIRILDALNEYLHVEEYFFSEDESEISCALVDADDSHCPEAINEMVISLLCEVDNLLPEGYVVKIQKGKFVVQRQTTAELAQWRELLEREAVEVAADPTDRWTEIPICFRLEVGAWSATDEQGNPVVTYGSLSCAHITSEPPTPAELAEEIESCRKTMARYCACSPEHVTPISLEEYLAAGNSLEE